MNGELTDEAIEEGRIAIMNLERELSERANDAVSTGSNKHHSTTDERRILDQMPREARLNNRLESLGLTVEELDDRGLLDGGGSVPSYVISLKNKSRRTLELQSRSHRLQGRDKETFTKLLNSFLHMVRTLVRKGLNLDVYCRRHDPNRRGLMRKKAFFTMLKSIGLPFTGRELQEITLHYMVPASDQADYISLLKDARIVNLGSISNAQPDDALQNDTNADPALGSEPDTGTNSPSREPLRGDMELGMHTLVLADVRRMLLESIRSLSKDQDDVYRMFARWDTQGTGTVTATQFLRVLARLHVDISDQDQDFLVELLDTNGMGRIDFEGLIAFCFASTPETDLLSPAGMISGGGSLSVGEDNVNNETMSAVSTEGNTSVDQRSHTNGSSSGPNSRRPRTATVSRPYNEYTAHAHSAAHAATTRLYPAAQQQPPPQQQTYYHHNTTVEEQQQRSMQQNNNNRANPRGIQRPLTASGRVPSTQDSSLSPSPQSVSNGARFFVRDQAEAGSGAHRTQSLVMEYGHTDRAGGMTNSLFPVPGQVGPSGARGGPQAAYAQPPSHNAQQQMRPASAQGQSHAQTLLQKHSGGAGGAGAGARSKHTGQGNNRGPEGEDSQYVVELPDDVMYGEEKYLGSDSARVNPTSKGHKTGPSANPTGGRYSDITAHTNTNNHVHNNNDNNQFYNHSHGHSNTAYPRVDSSPDLSNGNNGDSLDNMQENMHDLAEIGSFNDNTLITDQEEYFFGSPKEIPTLNNTRNLISNMNNMSLNNNGNTNGNNSGGTWANTVNYNNQNNNQNNNNNYPASANPSNDAYTRNTGRPLWPEPTENPSRAPYSNHNTYTTNEADNNNNYYNTANNNNKHNESNQPSSPAEPIEHLVLLATQILSTLREIIMGRYRRGRSLQEIYEHFDRNEKQYFDSADFVTATADLRIETSPRVAGIAVNMLALDGFDKVSFGEFKVFVLDSDHRLLELNVQEQLAQLLEQKGREYQSFMVDMFWNEEESLNDSTNNTSYNNTHSSSARHPGSNSRNDGFVSKIAFVSSLQRIGLVLTSSELNRLVDRFDVHGNEMCSVHRFVRMVQNSRAWHHGEKVLSYQDEALEEGEYLRQHLHHRHSNPSLHVNDTESASLPDLPLELIAMCEYLGIRVLSEPNMVWIAADALKAPLPVSWTAQKDSNGRTYFYNHLTNQTKLEHPLDPHFRKLRDKYRQGGANETSSDAGRVTSALPTNNNNTSTNNKSVNSTISFGGIGAALNPPPLNQSLVGTARPTPPPNSFQHLYSHANGEHQNTAEYHFPRVNNYNQGHPQGQNVSPSMQMMQDEDEALYVKYGNMGRDQLPNPSGNNNTGGGSRNAGMRRPQSALDRTQFSAQQQQQAKNQSRARDTADAAPYLHATSGGHPAGNHSGAPSVLPSGFSAGIYTAELKALMGSAAYNRPVSAPQNHHIQAEKLHAYNDATQRMQSSGNAKEEQKRNTMEQLEAVYTAYPKPMQRAQTSGAAATTGMNRSHSRNLNTNDAEPKYSPNGGLNRSSSAKWSNNGTGNGLGNNTPNTTSTPLSVVDRALSIGRSGSNAYLPSRVEQQAQYSGYTNNNNPNPYPNNNNNAPRERSRSANRTRRNVLPDEQTKQARLSEMFDEAILDKLDSAIGLHRR